MPKYKLPPGVPGINVGGQQYNADENGEITLPDDGSYVMPAEFERVISAAPVVKTIKDKAVTE